MHKTCAWPAILLGVVASCGRPAAPGREASPDASSRGHAQAHATHQHRFDDAAKWSKVFDDPSRDEWQKPSSVVAAMDVTSGMTVADVGAGTGYFLPHLSRAVGPNGKVLAEDVAPTMVSWMSDRVNREGLGNVETILGADDDPRLPKGTLDRILIVDTWHHVDDRPRFAVKLAEALKPGGAVFIVDFTADSPHGPPKSARLSPEAVISDLSSAGLEATQASAGLPFQYVVRGSRGSVNP